MHINISDIKNHVTLSCGNNGAIIKAGSDVICILTDVKL